VAVGAADADEGGASADGGRGVGPGRGRASMRMKLEKASMSRDDSGVHGTSRSGGEVERVIGRGEKETAGGLVALCGEQLVGDAHLDVVGFAGEDEEGFVLSLPAEAGDGAIVGAEVGVAGEKGVGMAGDALGGLDGGVGLEIGEDGGVGDGLDESCAEDGRGDAEDDVGIAVLAGEGLPAGRKSG